MGAADVVPGVSGGTIALLLGIYERLIASVRAASSMLGHALEFDREGAMGWLRRVEWTFVLPLVAGILLAVLTLAGVLETLLEDHPIQMSALFFGLIVGSVFVVWRMIRSPDRTKIVLAVVAAVLTFVLLGVREGVTEDNVAQVSDPSLLAFFGSGAIAICAMILPGISGSFLLVILGMYTAVLGAVDDRDVATLLVFMAGCIVGLALFSQFLGRMLESHHDAMMAVLIGLMAGSTRVLWPWPHGLESTALESPDSYVLEAVLLALAAGALVVGLTSLSQSDSRPRFRRRSHRPPPRAQ
jgi:putative membrane protein